MQTAEYYSIGNLIDNQIIKPFLITIVTFNEATSALANDSVNRTTESKKKKKKHGRKQPNWMIFVETIFKS